MSLRTALRTSSWIAAAAALAFAAAAARPPSATSRPARGIHPFELLSRTPAGTAPNAPAAEPALSGDSRVSRYAAYTSAATDIVAGSGDHRNVYLVRRARPWGENGTPWRQGPTILVSRGLGGRPANGDSWGPTFDGFEYVAGGGLRVAVPRCLAFVSSASNLVRGDGNGHADVFVRRLPGGRLTRIATRGAATEVDLDGRCHQVAYVAGGNVYVAPAGGRGRAQRVSRGGGAHSLTFNGNGHVAVFARGGWIYRWYLHDGTRRLTRGEEPTANVYGQYAAFKRGRDILQVNLLGHPRVTPVRQAGGGRAQGAEPSMSFGHSFVFYADGRFVRLNTFSTLMGRCEGGEARQPASSPHGNYVAFACSTGQVYLSYVGPK